MQGSVARGRGHHIAQQQRFLITGARAPVAVHLARLLTAAGHEVHLADHLAQPLGAFSTQHAGYHRLPSFRFAPDDSARALRDILVAARIDIVIPTCEEVFYLAAIWQAHDMPARLFAPDLAILTQVHDKFRFIALCAQIGLAVPDTKQLTCAQDKQPFEDSLQDYVFKPVWSRFATDVLIAPTSAQFAKVTPTAARPWVAQRYLRGQEICVYAVAHQGQVTAVCAYRGLIRAGRGAAVSFAPVTDPRVDRFVEQFVAATGWTGQISFDVMLTADGQILPLECNPRATSGVHFFDAQSDLATAIIRGDRRAIPSLTAPQGVRLAVWIYGAVGLFHAHSPALFWRALRDTQDILNVQGDRVGVTAQVKSLWEIARTAWQHRMTLQQASTYDLEYDGPNDAAASELKPLQ